MRIFVTGGTGFIGSHLVERLVEEKHEVTVLIRKNSKNPTIKLLKNLNVNLVYGDITNETELYNLTRNHDVIIHLAGASQVDDGRSYEEYLLLNTKSTEYLAKACIMNKIKRFIYFSSIEAYETPGRVGTRRKITEEDTPHPSTFYGKSKLEAEKIIKKYEKKGLTYSIIRPSVIFGPREIHGPIKLFKAINKGVFLFIGKGDNLISYCYVKNLVEATIQIMNSRKCINKTYFVSDEKAYTLKEFVTEIYNVMGKKPPRIHIPLWFARFCAIPIELFFKMIKKDPILSQSKIRLMATNFNFSIDKLKKDTNYKQPYDLKTAIKETYEWYKKNGYF